MAISLHVLLYTLQNSFTEQIGQGKCPFTVQDTLVYSHVFVLGVVPVPLLKSSVLSLTLDLNSPFNFCQNCFSDEFAN